MKNIFRNIFNPVSKVKSVPPRVMNNELANAYNTTRNTKDQESFCFAPTVNMLFAQDGSVKACCHNEKFSLGRYPSQSIREIWTSTKAEELREYMKRYDLSHGCSVCSFDIELSGFSEVRARYFDDRPRKTGYPAMMEFLLSNQCNLECIMCNGDFSSLIRKNREHKPPLEMPYDEAFLEQLKEFIPHLREARFSSSGEAFSIDMNYRIWEMIAELNPDCVVLVQTNGTILSQRVKNILSKCNFQIGVSLDSLNKETYESIRINANFDKVMDNIRFFSDYCQRKKTTFFLAMCVMRQNRYELPAFIRLSNELHARTIFHKVWAPTELALHNLSYKELEELHDKLKQFDYLPQNLIEQHNRRHYLYFLTVLNNWLKESKLREQAEKVAAQTPSNELFPLAIQRIRNHLDSTALTDCEKEEKLRNYEETTQKILDLFSPQHQEALLRMVCSEKPSKLLDSLYFNMDQHYENAKNALATSNLTFGLT